MDQEPNTAEPHEPRRRWFQFGLRTLLIGVVLLSCVLGWLGVKLQESRRQQTAVAAIEELGGEVVFDYEYDAEGNYQRFGAMQPARPQWLRSLLGDDFFKTALAVFLSGRPVTDAGLSCLDGLSHLRILWLENTPLTDAGLEHLRGLTSLEGLRLSDTRITDAGLEQIKRLTQLKWLSLHGTIVTDAGVANLQEALPNCAIDK